MRLLQSLGFEKVAGWGGTVGDGGGDGGGGGGARFQYCG